MQALPKDNLVTLIVLCHLHNKQSIRCTKCGSTHYWLHGSYYRKGTHFVWVVIPVQRFKCQESGCKKTFSLRPVPILPYTRFSLWHLIQIDEQLQSGREINELIKGFGLRRSVIIRAQEYLKRVKRFVEQELHILGQFNRTGLFSKWIELIKECSWFDLTWKFFHTLYPLRFTQGPPHTIR
jgi:hypothetical protein